MSPGVTVIVPVWNRSDLLRKLLATVSEQTKMPEDVVIVDNGSTDDAASVASRWGARVISMGRNVGFAAAANAGIAASGYEWVALVNSDVELHPEWLERLLAAAEEQQEWFAAGKVFQTDDPARLDGAYDLIARSGCAWRAGHGQRDSEDFKRQRRITMASATASLYRRELFQRIGNFAEVYGSYLEDVDLSLRAAAAGLNGIFVPSAICFHQGSASVGRWSNQTVYRIARNQGLLVRRILSDELRHKWSWKIRVGQWLWALVAFRHGRMKAWLRGRAELRRLDIQPLAIDSERIEKVITESERELRRVQQASGMNWYWRLYFVCTGGGSR